MTQCEAAGPIPMRMDDWIDATFWNSFECKTDGVERDETAESSSHVKGSDAADVNTETPTFVKPGERRDISTSDSAGKVKESFENVKLGSTADIETDRDSSVHFQNFRRKDAVAGKKDAAAESSALRGSSKRKKSKRRGAKAPKKKRPALRSEDD